MKKVVFKTVFVSILFSSLGYAGIATTKHNLSTSGPGPVKSTTESEICIFCHTPHNASPAAPLWNRDLTYQESKTYKPYTSPTIDAIPSPGQPQGESKLCLSCHDGTVALGQVLSRAPGDSVSRPGKDSFLLDQRLPETLTRNFRSDLSGNHPISFTYDDALTNINNTRDNYPLKHPSSIQDPDFHLDQGRVECTSCHEVHDDSNFSSSRVHFWKKPSWSGVCTICHMP